MYLGAGEIWTFSVARTVRYRVVAGTSVRVGTTNNVELLAPSFDISGPPNDGLGFHERSFRR